MNQITITYINNDFEEGGDVRRSTTLTKYKTKPDCYKQWWPSIAPPYPEITLPSKI